MWNIVDVALARSGELREVELMEVVEKVIGGIQLMPLSLEVEN